MTGRYLGAVQGFTCPSCGRVTVHPVDVSEGYCASCHDWTGSKAWRRAHKPDGFDGDDPPYDPWDEDHD